MSKIERETSLQNQPEKSGCSPLSVLFFVIAVMKRINEYRNSAHIILPNDLRSYSEGVHQDLLSDLSEKVTELNATFAPDVVKKYYPSTGDGVSSAKTNSSAMETVEGFQDSVATYLMQGNYKEALIASGVLLRMIPNNGSNVNDAVMEAFRLEASVYEEMAAVIKDESKKQRCLAEAVNRLLLAHKHSESPLDIKSICDILDKMNDEALNAKKDSLREYLNRKPGQESTSSPKKGRRSKKVE